MLNGPAGIATICYALILAIGVVMNRGVIVNLGVLALAGQAMLAMFTLVETDGRIQWHIAALVCGVVYGLQWKKFTQRWPRSERKAMRELFDEPTLFDLLFHDKRLDSWRNPK